MTTEQTDRVETPAPRGTAVTIAAAAVVLVVCLGGAAVAWQLRDAFTDRPSPAADYDSVGVPWWSGRKIHWAGHAKREDDVASYTATLEAGVFLHDRPQYPEQPGEHGLGTLTALFDDGTAEQLAARVVSVPMADPDGHLVAWAVPTDGSLTVTAFDTAKRVELGSQRLDLDDEHFTGLSAVVGDTVYLGEGGRTLAWHPRRHTRPEVVAGTRGPFSAVVGGSDEGLLVAGQGLRLTWLGSDGTRRRIHASLGTLSPDGRFVAALGEEGEYSRTVRAVPSDRAVDLGLPDGQQAYQARWAADGTLVVAAVPSSEIRKGWDDALEVTSYACDVDAGDCRELEGGPAAVFQLALYEDSFLGQFFITYEGALS